MAILSRNQLAAVRQRNDLEIAKGSKSAFGYPKDMIRDLLQTIDELNKSKKKWQRLATDRGESLKKIQSIIESSLSKKEVEDAFFDRTGDGLEEGSNKDF